MQRRIARSFSFLVLGAAYAPAASAQCFDWDVGIGNPGFTDPPFVARVYALASHDDGSPGGAQLYAGGQFVTAGGNAIDALARWNGSTWSPVGNLTATQPDPTGHCFETFDDGSGPALYAGGSFGIKRWDGSAWSSLNFGVDGRPLALQVFDDGSGPALFVGGIFVHADGVEVNGVAKWNGAQWSGLGTGIAKLDFVFAFGVYDFAVYDDGSGPALYAAGFFTEISGVAANHIARWNGTTWTPLGSGLNNGVNCLLVHDDGSGPQLYAGGSFTTAGGVPALRVARWNGATWSAVGVGMSGGASNPNVSALASFDDGGGTRLFAGGIFASAGGETASCIAAWDGAEWSPLRVGVTVPFPSLAGVFGLAVHDDGAGQGPALFVGGSFSTAGTHATHSIAKWRACTPVGTPFCFGDGSLATPCPCVPPNTVPNPPAAPGHGCANAFHLGGARLFGTGTKNPDTVVLRGEDQTPAGFSLFFVGTAEDPNGIAFADGVRCVAGSLLRFGAQFATAAGTVAYPNPPLGLTLPLSTLSGTTPGSGLTKRYQVFYRHATPGFCNPGTTNYTSAYRITW